MHLLRTLGHIYLSIYLSIYIYTHTHTHMYIYINIHAYIYTCISILLHVSSSILLHASPHTTTCASAYYFTSRVSSQRNEAYRPQDKKKSKKKMPGCLWQSSLLKARRKRKKGYCVEKWGILTLSSKKYNRTGCERRSSVQKVRLHDTDTRGR